jgi:hypothetical protein
MTRDSDTIIALRAVALVLAGLNLAQALGWLA